MNLNLTMLFQVLFFALFVWFSKRYVWQPLIGALNARRTTIADGLAAAEKGKLAEHQGQQQAQEVIDQARHQAGEIIHRAEARGADLVEDAKKTARDEAARLITAAHADIDTQSNKARETLRTQIGDLAIAGATQILHREIDPKAHTDLLNQLAAQLTTTSPPSPSSSPPSP